MRERWRLAFGLLALVLIAAPVSLAQEQDENDPARALALVREAIKARGGEAYLNIRTTMTRGQETQYEKGISGDPRPFVDYIAPNRERTDFGKGDSKYIQSNSELGNWIYDGKAKQIKDQTDEQTKSIRQGMRYDLDNLLRTANSQTGVKLVYLGRREPWRSQFSEAIRIEFSDGGAATMHFDTRSHLPLSVEYQTVAEKGPAKSETRYFRWVDFGGVKFPTIQDFFLDGQQGAHVSFDEVNLNASLPDKLFAKPANIKEVK